MSERKPSKRLFLSLAASCTNRSYLRLSLSSPDGLDNAVPDEDQNVTVKEFRSSMHRNKRFYLSLTLALSQLYHICQEKNIFFYFFLMAEFAVFPAIFF